MDARSVFEVFEETGISACKHDPVASILQPSAIETQVVIRPN